ncbi:uncharacterized protein [Palaemon carinicauda]|uniref:uncharacterized protein n=1 Tax=Palaemon carinicauda TaxID=392227 RepID=UPI0035B5B737
MNSKAKDEIDIGTELEQALRRIKAQEKMKFLLTLNEIRELKNMTIELKCRKIYATKEADILLSGMKSKDKLLPAQRAHITAEILELNNSNLCHKVVQSTLQKAAFNIQAQDIIHLRVHQLDAKADPECTPRVRNILTYHGSNHFNSKTLVNVIERKEELENEILRSKLKALTLIKNVKKKWLCLKTKGTGIEEGDKEIEEWQKKLNTRCAKLKVIAHMIKGLVSSSGLPWGSDHYFLKMMLLCDWVLLKGPDGSFKQVVKHVEKARKEKEHPGKQFQEILEETADQETELNNEKHATILDYITNVPTVPPLMY